MKALGKAWSESEETEVKNIEWLRREVLDNKFMGHTIHIDVLFELIDQLDEPEVLSQVWIDKNKTSIDRKLDGTPIYKVREELLQNLLVPKQKLPVIPKFVADWIEKYVEYGYDLYPALKKVENNARSWERTYDWYRNNTLEFVLAYLTQEYEIEVEEKQKYYLIFPSFDELGQGFNYLAKDTFHRKLWIEDSRTDGLDWEERSSFTENEIRDMEKGDILFEHFAVKVKELEE